MKAYKHIKTGTIYKTCKKTRHGSFYEVTTYRNPVPYLVSTERINYVEVTDTEIQAMKLGDYHRANIKSSVAPIQAMGVLKNDLGDYVMVWLANNDLAHELLISKEMLRKFIKEAEAQL